ncbi:WXG100 family type VII secretion target [Streptomyces sp. DT24]|uniref:WXG100 family type VII secretion target n=1 Tax=Streptomyces sp. DT24 TaxID=3416520 RepID=UPI003CEB611A
MSEQQPELAPEEQREQDQGRVRTQIFTTDVVRTVERVTDALPFGGGPRNHGRTSFEGHDLNVMIDLVEASNPEHLESAGQALWNARDAIREAAKELGEHIDRVDWQGESGNAFREWGKGLVGHAQKLGDFADAAGTQITVAGTGLASVRKSMPPRDDRLHPKKVDEIELPKRTDANPEYAAAVQVEKHRQEAINQVNRLASYYAVSEEVLASKEPPRFDKALDVDVPKPRGLRDWPPASGGSGPDADTSRHPTVSAVSRHPDISGGPAERGAAGEGGSQRVGAVGTITPVPDRSTSTEIDSVTAPPPPVTPASPAPTPSAPGGPGAGTGAFPPVSPVVNGAFKPVQTGTSRSTTVGDVQKAVGRSGSAPGRPGPGAGGTSAVGGPGAERRTGPMADGHPAGTGRPGGTAGGSPTAGHGGTQTGRSVGGTSATASGGGRPGGTGGRPMAGHTGGGPSSGPRAGRGNGIVGGTPQRGGSASGTTGSRGGSRGTVIGGESASQGRATGGAASGRGANGSSAGGARSGGRGTTNSSGVIGTPRGDAPGSRAKRKGFTSGGAGLVRGSGRRRDSDEEEQENTGTTRPDYLTEDEETWAARRPGAVPPVIE